MTPPLARLLVMAGRRLGDQLSERLEAKGWRDVPPPAGYVLLAARGGPTTGGEIAQALGMTKQSASKALDQLERRGFIQRTSIPQDGRVRNVELTPRGRELLAVLEEIDLELEREWAAVIGAEAVESMRAALSRMLPEAPR
ncbi:MarR family winged helix-turn-helix transcriptional regulator [Dactylosporangium darangshiense]|uniref:HTH marR-type domain-containing protein n=1 Tax=Dactylosporangium darangshiense TaxID=579108 RepID=A0ABP8D9L5_9ACTN|nr:MarR family transcriptional regulator [Dactylosporangium sp.]